MRCVFKRERKRIMNHVQIVIRGFWIPAAFLLVLSDYSISQEVPGNTPFSDGEVLQYKVRWNFIRLGTIVIHQDQVRGENEDKYLVRMVVRSSAGLPFISVNFINEAILRTDVPSLEYVRVISGDDSTHVSTFDYDEPRGTLIVVDSAQGSCLRRDSVRWRGPLYDALSLFMAARVLSKGRGKITLPTLNDYQIVQTDLEFTETEEEVEVSAFDKEIRCRYIKGNARWKGKSFAGMTGAFRGWLTDDEAALPIRAEVGIFLGSIVLELESYRRTISSEARHPRGETITSPGYANENRSPLH